MKTQDQVKLFIPFDIQKKDAAKRMVWGYASTEAMDAQGEIVKIDAIKSALPDYMKFGNVREMHQPSAVGKVKQASVDNLGLYIGVKVVDRGAWEKVEEGVYTGFSIGGKVLEKADDEITKLKLSEISLVDRPANAEAVFDVIKAYESEESVDEAKKEETTEEVVKENEDVVVEETKTEEVVETKPEEKTEEVTEEVVASDKVEVTEEDKEKAESAEDVKKNVHVAAELAHTASNLKGTADYRRSMGQETKHIDAAVEATAKAAAKELKDIDDEKQEVLQPGTVMEMAEQTEDMAKSDDEKTGTAMPNDEEIVAELEKQGVPVSQQSIDAAKDVIAGTIIKDIAKGQQTQLDHDAVKAELEKELQATLEKLNTVLKSQTTNTENPFVYYELKKVDEPAVDEPATATEAEPTAEIQKAETNGEIAKLDGLLSKFETLAADITSFKGNVEERLAKVERAAAPVMAKADIATVDRFGSSQTNEQELLTKIDTTSELLKKDPSNQILRKEASELQKQWMGLKGL